MEAAQRFPRGDRSINMGIIENEDDRTEMIRVRLAADVDEVERPAYEVMDTASATFAELIKAYSNRPSEFFFFRPNHVNLCQMPIPVREMK